MGNTSSTLPPDHHPFQHPRRLRSEALKTSSRTPRSLRLKIPAFLHRPTSTRTHPSASEELHSERSSSDVGSPYDDASNVDTSSIETRASISPDYERFLAAFPEYALTASLDILRSTELTRLDKPESETYVDYMGGSLFPERLVKWHSGFLQDNILGNTHSISSSSQLSARHASEARKAVLDFFDAPADQYTVVFTSSTTAAIKLVAESFPFGSTSSLILPADAHNSVHGIRCFAKHNGSQIHYLPTLPRGGVLPDEVMRFLESRSSSEQALDAAPSLFVLTGQSNISNSKTPLSLFKNAKESGLYTLLDAAALAPTSIISLQKTPVDAVAISFYKMFGYPTGVGALIVRKDFLELLSKNRPWFAGGTVDVVQVPGSIVSLAEELHERFEDGTINYLALPAITEGLQTLKPLLPMLPLRLSSLTLWLVKALEDIKHPSGVPCVQILSRTPSSRLTKIGEQSDVGSVISLLFHDPQGNILPLSFISYCAFKHRISLRTGCMCNPGGAATLLGINSYMDALTEGATLRELESHAGRELGVVRISLGLGSNFNDVQRVIQFAEFISDEFERQKAWTDWMNLRDREELGPCCNTASRA
ncbi:PLP-dependent transferase [Sistotremastrum niveocremeum HHB9708]|uniref:PLP-dependent transferase n=1 Tax=Sistotremastrum niveocremeum HHB9708 TaxID=1314777 RepID=A0A164NZG4_9AGAM|nr:PLP-dependent transferase [Sistotremastrum niveocremeum HHB9708]